MFSAAIFDMDGLLLDSERVIMQTWLQVAQQLGCRLSEEQYVEVIGRSAPTSDQILAAYLGGAQVFQTARSDVAAHLQALGDLAFLLKPGAVELLEALRHTGIACAVASSTEIAEVHRRLNAVGISHYFSAVAGGDEVAAGKPSPDVYLLAAGRLALPPQACLAFEDSKNGMTAALAAGIRVVVIPDVVPPKTENAFAVFSSLSQARKQIEHWFAGAPNPAAYVEHSAKP